MSISLPVLPGIEVQIPALIKTITVRIPEGMTIQNTCPKCAADRPTGTIVDVKIIK